MQLHLLKFTGTALRYGAVGISVSIFYSLLVIGLVDGLGMRTPTMASAMAFAVASPVSYFLQSRFAFRSGKGDKRQPLRFAVTVIFSFVTATCGMYLITEVLRWSYLIGIAFTWVVIPMLNLLINMIWVFRQEFSR